jgi:hypothetical protein
MKGHVSYERTPMHGYIYNHHFSIVNILFIFLFNIYFIILNGFLHIPSIFGVLCMNQIVSPHCAKQIDEFSIPQMTKFEHINDIVADMLGYSTHVSEPNP